MNSLFGRLSVRRVFRTRNRAVRILAFHRIETIQFSLIDHVSKASEKSVFANAEAHFFCFITGITSLRRGSKIYWGRLKYVFFSLTTINRKRFDRSRYDEAREFVWRSMTHVFFSFFEIWHFLVLIPWLTTNPAELHARCRANLDAGAFRSSHSFFNALHQILGISDKHVRGFLIFFRTWWKKNQKSQFLTDSTNKNENNYRNEVDATDKRLSV